MNREPDAPSPCVAICRLDPASSYCVGCFRTVQEIAAWPMLSKPERLEILARLPARRAADEVARER